MNLLTGSAAEIGPWLASHMDVNAIDLAGVTDAELAADLEREAAGNLKRVVRPPAAPPTGPPTRARTACWPSWRPRPSGTPSAPERLYHRRPPRLLPGDGGTDGLLQLCPRRRGRRPRHRRRARPARPAGLDRPAAERRPVVVEHHPRADPGLRLLPVRAERPLAAVQGLPGRARLRPPARPHDPAGGGGTGDRPVAPAVPGRDPAGRGRRHPHAGPGPAGAAADAPAAGPAARAAPGADHVPQLAGGHARPRRADPGRAAQPGGQPQAAPRQPRRAGRGRGPAPAAAAPPLGHGVRGERDRRRPGLDRPPPGRPAAGAPGAGGPAGPAAPTSRPPRPRWPPPARAAAAGPGSWWP